ncbi:O-antigen ligase [Variovorax paradoxus]|uniref:O-antigen polymerase n=1 Tax=Variovorax paradoxus TaxID=34073 RepID=UPI003ED02B5A
MAISPLSAFTLIWSVVAFLYYLRFSYLQIYGVDEIVGSIWIFYIPFAISYLMVALFPKDVRRPASEAGAKKQYWNDPIKLKKRVDRLFFLFIAFFIFEVAIAGYIPLISMIGGSEGSQFDFGIPSLHGFVLAFGALISSVSYLVYLKTEEKKYLYYSVAIAFIFALLVTRKMIMVSVVQIAVIHFFVKGFGGAKRIFYFSAFALLVVFVFGWIGDIRTGRDLFLSLANTTESYPDWLPSGFMWVYIYLVTPILNFTNAIHLNYSYEYNWSFLCSWFPSVLRDSVGCTTTGGGFDNYYQISGAFNVATGYLPLYDSAGYWGVGIFSALHGMLAAYSYKRLSMDVKSILFYVFIFQITIMLIFSNGFLNLNVMAQLPLIYLCFRRPRRRAVRYLRV